MGLAQIAKENTCCFTGHRAQKLPWGTNESDPRCISLRIRLYDTVEELYENGVRHFICGMAQGCDLLFCEEVMKLREDKSDVTLEAALPCETQPDRWSPSVQSRYRKLLEQCDYVTVISQEYTEGCMKQRNKYMVDKSSVIVAVYSGRFGGTMQTLNYAGKSGLKVISLEP